MIDVAPEREKAFKRIGDVCFDLLRRHAAVEGRNDHHRNLDLRKEIYRHSRNCRDTDHDNRQTQHQNEKGIFDCKT